MLHVTNKEYAHKNVLQHMLVWYSKQDNESNACIENKIESAYEVKWSKHLQNSF